MTRYYCPQYLDAAAGWVDIEPLASKSKKEADDAAEAVAHERTVTTRAVRKPKGWEPNREKKAAPPYARGFGLALSEQVKEARKAKA